MDTDARASGDETSTNQQQEYQLQWGSVSVFYEEMKGRQEANQGNAVEDK